MSLRANFDPTIDMAKNMRDHGIPIEAEVYLGLQLLKVMHATSIKPVQVANMLEIWAESIYAGQANNMFVMMGLEPIPILEPELRKEPR